MALVLPVETDNLDTHVLQSASESYLPGCLNTCPQWKKREVEREGRGKAKI